MTTGSQSSHLELDSVLDEMVDWRFKAFPLNSPIPVRHVRDQNWNALVDFTMPVMVLKESAIHHNLLTFSRYCREGGVALAPHAKTSMAPQLVELQLANGAWGITAATVSQARIWRTFGAQRILLANEVVDRSAIRWLVGELESDPGFEAYCLVDSRTTVDLLGGAMRTYGGERPLNVLVELGFGGGRTGCRGLDEAMAVAHAVASRDSLQLAGAEGFEGIIGGADTPDVLRGVDRFLGELRRLVERCDGEGLFTGARRAIVTAGGSAFPDRVIDVLGGRWNLSLPVEVVLRSGCYLTHDAGHYEELGPLGNRLARWPRLRNAMEIWGAVLSIPEPGFAILNFGKRDVSYDLGLPRPLLTARGNGMPEPLPSLSCSIGSLNDQHAYMSFRDDIQIRIGDLVGCGVSHPCTAFDKWRLLALVDDEYRVTAAVVTYF